MGTYTLPHDSTEFDPGESAQGSEVFENADYIADKLNSADLDSTNINMAYNFPWTGRHSWTVADANNDNLALAVSSVMAANKYGFKISSSVAQINSALVYLALTSSSAAVPVLHLIDAGTGSTLTIDKSGNAIVSDFEQSSTSATANVYHSTQAGTGYLYGGTLRTLTGLNSPMVAKTITSTTTVSNSSTETAISDLTTSLPASFLKAGTTIRGKIYGTLDTPGAGPATARIRVKYGGTSGTTLLDTGAVTHTTSLSGSLVVVDFTLTCTAVGASGTIECQGITQWGSNTAPAGRGMGTGATGAGNTSAVTIDTTTANDLVVTFTWGSAVSGCTTSYRAGHLEILR